LKGSGRGRDAALLVAACAWGASLYAVSREERGTAASSRGWEAAFDVEGEERFSISLELPGSTRRVATLVREVRVEGEEAHVSIKLEGKEGLPIFVEAEMKVTKAEGLRRLRVRAEAGAETVLMVGERKGKVFRVRTDSSLLRRPVYREYLFEEEHLASAISPFPERLKLGGGEPFESFYFDPGSMRLKSCRARVVGVEGGLRKVEAVAQGGQEAWYDAEGRLVRARIRIGGISLVLEKEQVDLDRAPDEDVRLDDRGR